MVMSASVFGRRQFLSLEIDFPFTRRGNTERLHSEAPHYKQCGRQEHAELLGMTAVNPIKQKIAQCTRTE